MQSINYKIKRSTKYPLEVVNEFSSNSGHYTNIHKSIEFLYISNDQLKNKNLKSTFYSIIQKHEIFHYKFNKKYARLIPRKLIIYTLIIAF